MKVLSNLQLSQMTMPVALYDSSQLYAIEQAWFAQGYDSFGLMQQAAWQMTQHIKQLYENKYSHIHLPDSGRNDHQQRVSIWVGQGNNGGDGWLIAHYLQQAGWQVNVITVGTDKDDVSESKSKKESIFDAIKARQIALSTNCPHQRFDDSQYSDLDKIYDGHRADVYVDALFGIGLDRAPIGTYKQAIKALNNSATADDALVIAVDIPSGLMASTGQVFDRIAVQADVTLCLIARKFGLHTKDGMDYSGEVIDIPLIPNQKSVPIATLFTTLHSLTARRQNSHKGSYGHVLIIGGNRIDGSQGMGGAAILAASSAMATGAGKITVACHDAFHGAVLTSLPDAMTLNLHDQDSVKNLIKDASIVAIGMGLGRDEKAKDVFIRCIQVAMEEGTPIVIDADGLYHLASLRTNKHKLLDQLREYSAEHKVCFTPHSGEAAKLLNKEIQEIENNRLVAIKQCATIYGGEWVLKGAGSLILEQVKLSEQVQILVCGVGNAGMATAGMGDVLSGLIAGLWAQQDLEGAPSRVHQAVLIHGLAGDTLVNQLSGRANTIGSLLIGQRGLQAQDMPPAIRHVMQSITRAC